MSNQLQEYKKLFNEIYIIVPHELLYKYIEFDKNIGIITYDSIQRNLSKFKNRFFNSNIDADVLMEVLHTKEYLAIIKKYYNEIPEMKSFNQFNICKKLIARIPKEELSELFISKMKERNINNFVSTK